MPRQATRKIMEDYVLRYICTSYHAGDPLKNSPTVRRKGLNAFEAQADHASGAHRKLVLRGNDFCVEEMTARSAPMTRIGMNFDENHHGSRTRE